MNQTWVLIGAGLLGVLIHCLIKLDSLRKDAKAANVSFNWVKNYWDVDAFAILLSVAVSLLWHLVYPEVAAYYPKLQGFITVSYATMGALGSYIIQLVLGRAKKFIRNIVDKKTNDLDELKNKLDDTKE